MQGKQTEVLRELARPFLDACRCWKKSIQIGIYFRRASSQDMERDSFKVLLQLNFATRGLLSYSDLLKYFVITTFFILISPYIPPPYKSPC